MDELAVNEVLIKLVGLALGGYHPLLGQYVVAFDPTIAADGSAWLDTTTDPSQAARFADAAAALELWRAVSPNRPVRSDGRPNRPMTVFTVEIVPLARAMQDRAMRGRAMQRGVH